jgi:tetratricopeptide (TPR) repeat protein
VIAMMSQTATVMKRDLDHASESPTNPPRAIEAIYAIGHALLEQHRATEAVKVFRVMVRLAPADERAWLGIGLCHEEMDQLEIASELYGVGAAVAQPPSARCSAALARTLRLLGNVALADEYDAESLSLAEEHGIDLGGAR